MQYKKEPLAVSEKDQPDAEAEAGKKLLIIVSKLAEELHQQSDRSIAINLDSNLERELGFDSLTSVELMLRVKQAFNVELPEQVLQTTDTPRDLLQAIFSDAAQPIGRIARDESIQPTLDATVGLPQQAQTLPQVLDWHLTTHPQRTHVYLYGEGEKPEEISYQTLYAGARAMATGLQARDIAPGSAVAIMLPTSREYLYSFFGILLAGCIPVPIYPPVRLSQLEDHVRRHTEILRNAGAILLITVPEARTVGRLLKTQVETLQDLVTTEMLTATDGVFSSVPIQAEDIAFLQYTSGSTGQPKGVVLTHDNLLQNIRAMGEATQVDSTDIFVSWLPLYHDMGLIGAWLGSLYYAIPLVLMSPLAFLADPVRWLWAIHNHHGTLSAAPNFAYELCYSKLQENDIEGLDLGSWRRAFNGAEPVSPRTIEQFTQRFARYGFRRETMAPVYGLAEAAVGLAFPPIGRDLLIDHIQREALLTGGKAIPAEESEQQPLEFVACGQPLPGYQIRVVSAAGRELPERREGRIEFQGPSATSGYFNNPEASSRLFDGEWLETGDLGYIANGDLYLTSRSKDLIIRGGRNLYPYEVEQAVGDIPGIRKGCVALFGNSHPASGTEQVVLVAESREWDTALIAHLQNQARAVATSLLGMPPDDVVIAPRHTVLKTSSGKIRRSAVRELYQQGKIGRKPLSVWQQITRLALGSLRPGWRRLQRRLLDIGYAAYVHFLFWIMTPPVWLAVAALPLKKQRWVLMGGAARLLFRLARVPLQVEGITRLPQNKAYVLVANHSSYLDGIALVACLPHAVAFIAKEELGQKPIPRIFLQRIGALFVERFDRQQSVADARRTEQKLRRGSSLFYFPEGTLRRAPGLLPFHMGAFVAATETDTPVVPLTIKGTRSILRDTSWFPHRGRIIIQVSNPIAPHGSDWAAAVKLRDAARSEILHQLEEPDLQGARS